MTDDTAPVTATQFEQLLHAALQPINNRMETFATKDDVQLMVETALQPIKENMATKDDIRALEVTMKEENRWIRDRLEWLRKGIDQALVVFGNADGERKSDIKNHERRIKRLEKKVGLVQIAA